MHAILLAAGSATRLRPLTSELPKCLLPVGGRTILARTVELLSERGIRRFVIVDGFFGEKIRASLAARFPPEWFTFVRNGLYATTNNAYSLMLGLRARGGAHLLLDSDVLFDGEVLDRLLEDRRANRIALRTRGGLGPEEMKVTLTSDARVLTVGKGGDPALAAGESVGIHVFGETFAAELRETLERRQLDEGRVGEFYEASFQGLIDRGAAIHAVPLGALRSMEIDTPEDLERARETFHGS